MQVLCFWGLHQYVTDPYGKMTCANKPVSLQGRGSYPTPTSEVCRDKKIFQRFILFVIGCLP